MIALPLQSNGSAITCSRLSGPLAKSKAFAFGPIYPIKKLREVWNAQVSVGHQESDFVCGGDGVTAERCTFWLRKRGEGENVFEGLVLISS